MVRKDCCTALPCSDVIFVGSCFAGASTDAFAGVEATIEGVEATAEGVVTVAAVDVATAAVPVGA